MIRKWQQRARSVLHRARFERELDTELQFHLDMLIARNMRDGMTRPDARRAALQAFGPVAAVKDHVRDTWLSGVLESAGQDIRYGLRMLGAAPAFAAGLILTIALAVGVNTAIFGLTHSILLKPLPFEQPDALVLLEHGNGTTGPIRMFSHLELNDYRRMRTVEGIAELHTMWFILLGRPEPERVSTGVVSVNYFSLLGVRPVLGRGLLPSDDATGAPAVLVLSFEYWKRGFNGDPSVVGREFEMNDRSHRVVGVLPPFPSYPEPLDVYMPTAACPFRSSPQAIAGRTMRMSRALARVRPGVSRDQLETDLAAVSAGLHQRYPNVYGVPGAAEQASASPYRATAVPLAEEMRRGLRPTLLLLVATAALVLMIACVSVSNLTLARLMYRGNEVSLRAALGASRGRLVRQLLTENTAVVALGSLLGLLLARSALAMLTAYLQRGTTLSVDTGLTAPALAAALTVSVVLLFMSAALPLVKRRASLHGAVPHQPGARIRYGLVTGQVSLSFVLMIAAGLSVRSLLHLQGIDTGFRTEYVHTLRLDLNFTKYRHYTSITKFWKQFEQELAQGGGIAAAGGAGRLPLDGGPLPSSFFQLEEQTIDADSAAAPNGVREHHIPERPTDIASRANVRVASPGYFAALGQRVIEGRTFTRDDVDPRRPVVVVNEALARRYWPGSSAVGRRLRIEGVPLATVIGIVDDTRQRLNEAPGGEIYLPLLQTGQLSTNWLVRSTLAPAEVERRVRAIVRAIDPDQAVDSFRSLESLRDESLLPSRVTASVVSLFSLLALVITATGIGGVIGFAVQQRRHEFGVRLALGAQRHRLVAMVVGDGLRLVCVGLTLGVLASLPMFPIIRGVLSGVETFDPATFVLVSGLLLFVTAGACFVPARRAASVDPLLTLRAN